MRRLLRYASWGIVALGGLIALNMTWLAVAARTVGVPAGLGARDGRLAPCPPSPNCVSTQADPQDRLHYMAPLPLGGDPDAVAEQVRVALAAEPRGELLSDDGRYFHTVFRSPTAGYPDDVEILIDPAAGLIHFRSAARLGYGDGGVNRARMGRIGAAIQSGAAR
jgi:uncharacterized protein (DUF1499 family)